MRLDLTAMERDKMGIRALPKPMPPEVVSFFRKTTDLGPFTFMLDMDEMKKIENMKYLQITVDFNKTATEKYTRDPNTGEFNDYTEYSITIGQRGAANNLVPQEHLEGRSAGYSYEEYRKRQKEAADDGQD
jgi:hypothetical protein